MTTLTLAAVVGSLFATGTYLILQRRAIRLILGLSLLSHGVHLLLFSSGGLGRGLPPILDKETFDPSTIDQFVDPLPQALILTAIVISFGVIAFTVVLVNRRNILAAVVGPHAEELPSRKATDPFASVEHYHFDWMEETEDYEWLEYTLAEEYRKQRARVTQKNLETESGSNLVNSESATPPSEAQSEVHEAVPLVADEKDEVKRE